MEKKNIEKTQENQHLDEVFCLKRGSEWVTDGVEELNIKDSICGHIVAFQCTEDVLLLEKHTPICSVFNLVFSTLRQLDRLGAKIVPTHIAKSRS